jgi:hypothetical protein
MTTQHEYFGVTDCHNWRARHAKDCSRIYRWGFDRRPGCVEASALGQSGAKDQAAEASKIDLVALNNDVARLKDIVPSNSHLMADVATTTISGLQDRKKIGPSRCFTITDARPHRGNPV